ncbi:MAG: hypothetical protein HQK89_00545 [Nitrospirae bacterium]|nr:hypothetical protein [Nitrospirota bacterium]
MSKLSDELDKQFSAITFAEAGEFDTARDMLNEGKQVTPALQGAKADTLTAGNQKASEWRKETLTDNYARLKKKPYSKTLILGLISLSLYVVLFERQHEINDLFSKGGIYAFLPIIAAFIFSFFHGGFTGGFWEIIGIDAKKQKR